MIRHERGITGDEPFYEAMAEHPGGPHNFPYAYRVVVPWLVHVLPFSHLASFTIIGLLAIGIAAAALYELLRDFRVHGPPQRRSGGRLRPLPHAVGRDRPSFPFASIRRRCW